VSEEEVRRAAALLESYRAQLEALERQSNVVRLSVEEFRRARESVSQYASLPAGREVLLPIGANSFVRAASADPGRVLVGIGSDLVVEDSAETALKRLEARIASLEEAAEAVGARLRETQARVEAQGAHLEELYESAQAPPR
jgi:prefoldin alpha subunit